MATCLLVLMFIMSSLMLAASSYLGGYYHQKKVDETVRHWHEILEWGSRALTLVIAYLLIMEVTKGGLGCIRGLFSF